MELPVYSNTLDINGLTGVNFDLSFLRTRGLAGTRRVCTGMIFRVAYQVDTDATTSLTGADLFSAIQELRIRDREGRVRRKLKGSHLRSLARNYYGYRFRDPTAIGTGQTNATGTLYLPVPFADPFRARRGWDTGFPLDELVGGQIDVDGANGTTLLHTGLTTMVIDSLTCQVQVFTRNERGRERHAVDIWDYQSVAAANIADFSVPIKGRALAELALTQPAAGAGGGNVIAPTNVTIQSLDLISQNHATLREWQALTSDYDATDANDPIDDGEYCRLWSMHKDQKIWECPIIDNDLRVETTGLALSNNIDVIKRVYDEHYEDELARGGPSARIKTAGKTRRQPEAWGDYRNFMPHSPG